MLGDIDYTKKPYKPNYFLAKPDKQIIGKLSEAYKDSLSDPINETSELTLSIPYFIDENHVLTFNKHVDMIKENYLIRLVFGKTSEWYVITTINEIMNDDSSYKQLTLLGLEFELAQRVLKGYKAESKGAKTALTEMLNETTWTVGDVDPDFELSKRSFEFLDNKLLGSIYDVADTYNAIVQFDTNLQTVNLKKPELFGADMGLTFSYESLLKSFDKKSDTNELVTRLHLKGKDGLIINSIHPTGKDYLEDYSYFMYPFHRDEDKNVIEHSYSMSDSLCHAILDYQELVKANKDQFSILKTARDGYVTTLSTKQSELVDLQNQLKLIYNIVDNYQLGNNNKPTMFFESVSYNGSSKTINFDLQTMYPYAVMAKVSNATNVQVSLNGALKTVFSNTWTLLGKVSGLTTSSVLIAGNGSANVAMQVTAINESEYDTSSNDTAIIDRYCPNNKQMQIDGKKNEITEQTGYLNTILAQIASLQSLLSSSNNFTPDQLIELQRFVKIETYENSNCIDAEDLLKYGEENFAEVKVPQMSMEIDLVYFLSVLEEQSKWDKLNKGDYVSIKYERIGVNVKAKIIEINYDFEGEKISITLSNVRNDGSAASKMNEFMKKSSNSSTTIDANKKDWLKSVTDISDMSLLFDEFWDKVTNQINMSINNTVTTDNRGITITDPNDMLRFIRLTAGSIGITKSGGLRYETALTADGIIAETLYGKIILSQRVIVGDAAGIWLMEGPKTTIKDRYGRVAMMLGLYEENPDKFGMIINRYNGNDANSTLINKVIANSEDGFKIQRWNGYSFDDKLHLDTDGNIFGQDITAKRLKIISDQNELLLDSYTKEMNIGKFDNIITDGKLTAIEKLQVLGERTRIISEYAKLFDQAEQYKKTTRDDTIRINIPPFTASYNALIAYLEPLLSNMTETSTIDRDGFIQKFKTYYDQVVAIVQGINDSIKYSSLQLGSLYNGVILDALNGVTVTRSDEMYRTRLNATEGISIEKQINGQWVKKFFIDATTSRLMVEELIAKKLTIVNDLNDVFLDIDSSYLNIGRFTNIITDNKLTSIEKLSLLQEWQTIQTEYVKLLQQANQYKTSQRDNHQTVLIDIPPFTSSFNELAAYVIPLLADMSATTDINRDDFKNKFQSYYDQAQRIINEITDAVKWSSLQLGVAYNRVVIDAISGIVVTRSDNVVKAMFNATEGISIESNGEKVFFVDANGILRTKKMITENLKVTTNAFGDSNDGLLMDAESRTLWLNRWNVIGIAALNAEMIAATFLSSDFGFISNLIANKLSTLTNSVINGWTNYIEIQGNSASWLTGRVSGAGVQKTLPDGTPMYWIDSSKSGQMTNEVTPWPAYAYPMDSIKKLSIEFKGEGEAAYPVITLGQGTGAGAKAGKGLIEKQEGNLGVSYYSGDSNQKERSLVFNDASITLLSENGTLDIKHSSGVSFNINTDGTSIKMFHPTSGEVRLTANGLAADITGSINLKASEAINMNAPQYNFA
ncbi:phage tail spike protein [Paenibacillus sp. FSL E2-0178]|uniref:phage tail spike protein n=1 Tax=Paenibacillus sp. FSL E2-0178 TaxID=2921361 RepID=UPI0031596CF2